MFPNGNLNKASDDEDNTTNVFSPLTTQPIGDEGNDNYGEESTENRNSEEEMEPHNSDTVSEKFNTAIIEAKKTRDFILQLKGIGNCLTSNNFIVLQALELHSFTYTQEDTLPQNNYSAFITFLKNSKELKTVHLGLSFTDEQKPEIFNVLSVSSIENLSIYSDIRDDEFRYLTQLLEKNENLKWLSLPSLTQGGRNTEVSFEKHLEKFEFERAVISCGTSVKINFQGLEINDFSFILFRIQSFADFLQSVSNWEKIYLSNNRAFFNSSCNILIQALTKGFSGFNCSPLFYNFTDEQRERIKQLNERNTLHFLNSYFPSFFYVLEINDDLQGINFQTIVSTYQHFLNEFRKLSDNEIIKNNIFISLSMFFFRISRNKLKMLQELHPIGADVQLECDLLESLIIIFLLFARHHHAKLFTYPQLPEGAYPTDGGLQYKESLLSERLLKDKTITDIEEKFKVEPYSNQIQSRLFFIAKMILKNHINYNTHHSTPSTLNTFSQYIEALTTLQGCERVIVHFVVDQSLERANVVAKRKTEKLEEETSVLKDKNEQIKKYVKLLQSQSETLTNSNNNNTASSQSTDSNNNNITTRMDQSLH